jgi:uncharacterized protein (TIGR00369 family)
MLPEPPRGFDPLRLINLIATHGHTRSLGVRYVGHGGDWVELAIDYDPRFAVSRETGILASGPIITLMDIATSLAIWMRTERFVPMATLDLRVDYLRAAIPGRTVIGHGECYRVTRRIAFVRGYAHDGDDADPIAHVAGTYMFIGE